MDRLRAFFKKWITDGWLTTGPQIGCPENQIRVFMRCVQCQRVFPHWWASMTAAEVKKRGKLGCRCGSLRVSPAIIPSWQSFYWYVIRGWFIRHVLFQERTWDPRMVAMERDLS